MSVASEVYQWTSESAKRGGVDGWRAGDSLTRRLHCMTIMTWPHASLEQEIAVNKDAYIFVIESEDINQSAITTVQYLQLQL